MDAKIGVPLYAEHLHLLKSECGWRITNIRVHYTFEQGKFRKEFVIMNQVSRQNSQTDVEKDFYKLMNSANFDYDCRNNANNWYFHPVYDEIEELFYTKRYQNVLDQDISEFVSTEILECQIEEKFLRKLYALDTQDEYYEAKKKLLEIQKKGTRCCFFHEKVNKKKA